MKIEQMTSRPPETAPSKVVYFPRGIPGFETYTRFRVFHKHENKLKAYWLESTDEPQVTFTMLDPTDLDIAYALELSDEEQELLQVQSAESCGVFILLSKKSDDPAKPSFDANIGGPLVINLENRIGLQKVISRSQYTQSIAIN
ncbi:MAG: flagellar assembly protein FliW [Desulfobacterales bacterium]|nr:flagellar assembly protein FliW [Deltaproteobacteria bacterium]NNK93395.1 flagellar assembly protein FliW [Desulfobacterales bacterium]